MSRVLFAPLGIVAGLIAGFGARKAFDLIWARIDNEDPPEAEARDVSYPKLAAALAIEGATFRVVKGITDHGARRAFAGVTGRWPGETDAAE